MGSLARRLKRYRKAIAKDDAKGPCYDDGCNRKGITRMECGLCVSKGRSFVVVSCGPHSLSAREKMKRHCMTKHPGIIPSWMVAALGGGDMR